MLKTKAIVLHAFRYGESSHIIHILTREQGLMSCLVKGNHRNTSLSPVLMQPFSVIDTVIDVRSNRQFQFLRESTPVVLMESIPNHPIKNGIAFFLCETLYRALRESPADAKMFDFIAQSIIFFDRATRGVANFHLVFLIKLTYFLGFFPNLSDFHAGVFFDMENSQFVDSQTNLNTLDAGRTEVFAQLMRMDYANMQFFVMSGAQRSDVLDQILIYYRLHLPAFGEIKSFEVLRQMFA